MTTGGIKVEGEKHAEGSGAGHGYEKDVRDHYGRDLVSTLRLQIPHSKFPSFKNLMCTCHERSSMVVRNKPEWL